MSEPADRGAPAPTPALARAILARMGEIGQPPEIGVEHVNVGNERYLGVLDREYLTPISESGRGSSFKLVQAHFGGGKTHFLLCVRERAWRRGLATALVGLSPEECPFDDALRVYQAVVRELCLPPTDPAVAPDRGLEATLGQLVQDRRAALGDAALLDWVEGTLRRLPVDAPSYRAAVVAYFKATLAGSADGAELALAWLRGEPLSDEEARPLGIRERMGRDNGLRMLRSLCQVLQGLGVPGLLLSFDELDRNLSLTPKRRTAVADNLRQIIDLCGREALPGLLFLYAVPPEFMRTVVAEYPALQQRLEGPSSLTERSPQAAVIDLERLDLPASEVLVRIGQRLLQLFEIGRGARFDRDLQTRNLRALADEVLAGSFEVAHRRAYVKAAVDLLHGQALEPRPIGEEQLRGLVGTGGKLVLLRGGHDPFDDL